tara:strand:- start:957 stop:1496 length:540 start_codon:yes stop_codon:yes gene_type:complete
METKLTSHEIMCAYFRIGELMDEGGDPTTGAERQEEIDVEALGLLEALATETPEKLEKLRAVARHLEAEAEMLRAEEKRLAARRRSRERGLDRVKSCAGGILSARREAGQEAKVSTESGTFWLASSTSLSGPSEVSAWVEQGWTKTKVEPDKTAAKKALKAGADAQGFELVTKESIRWR